MTLGTLYGIGIGPGDPDWITVKGAGVLQQARHVFVPKARTAADSLALTIAGKHISQAATIHELVFPMTADAAELESRWRDSARQVCAVLRDGHDACFLTLGDPFLYSTYIYLLRAVRRELSDARVVTVPGVTAFCAAAALAAFPIGEGKKPVTIVPTSDDMEQIRRAIGAGGTVVLMKIGKRLPEILEVLEDAGVIGRSVLISRVGLPEQRIETDLAALRARGVDAEYLAVILVQAE